MRNTKNGWAVFLILGLLTFASFQLGFLIYTENKEKAFELEESYETQKADLLSRTNDAQAHAAFGIADELIQTKGDGGIMQAFWPCYLLSHLLVYYLVPGRRR